MTVNYHRRGADPEESAGGDTDAKRFVIGNPGDATRSPETDRIALFEAAQEKVRRLAPRSGVGGRFESGHQRTDHDSRARLIGTVTHTLIATHALAGIFSTDVIFAETKQLLARAAVNPTTRRAISVGVLTQVKTYGRFFRSPDLRLVGAEVVLDSTSRCDLVWRLPDGRILIDEVKTGIPNRINWTPNEQVRRYLDIARVTYAPDFYGLRVCWLRAPAHSATFDASGLRMRTGPSYDSQPHLDRGLAR